MPAPSGHVKQLRDSWRDNAQAWTSSVRAHAIESRRLATDAAIVGAVLARQPKSTLDLGCGEGWLVRALSERGLTAVGIDGSAPLIEAASSAGGLFLNLTYDELITDPGRCGASFDLVVANFALLEERIGPLLQALRRTMTRNAWLLIQTLHPLAAGAPYADGWRIEDFRGFEQGAWTPMPWYFRTLGSWVTVLQENGFGVHGLAEPIHPEDGRPLSLLLEARVAPPSG